MWLEDGSDIRDSGEWAISVSPETSREKSEKASEQAKKAAKRLMQTRADEKKAQKSDAELFRILQSFIQDNTYSTLLDAIVWLLQNNISSNFIIGIVSLVYPLAETYIIEQQKMHLTDQDRMLFDWRKYTQIMGTPFHDDILDLAVRKRITDWIDDMTFILTKEASLIKIQEMLPENTLAEQKKSIHDACISVFIFFFSKLNIAMTLLQAETYIQFIIDRIYRQLHNTFLHSEKDEENEALLSPKIDLEKEGGSLFFNM